MQNESAARQTYLDYLRVFATLAVIILHIASSDCWYTTDVNSFEWQTLNFYDSIVRWAVPVFVMISGALFLRKDIPVKMLYSKYILRMVTAFLVWSLIYAAVDLIRGGSTASVFFAFIRGHYHLWFLFMIIGLYMCVPLIRAMAGSGRLIKYYLLLSLLFAFLLPQAVDLMTDFGSGTVTAAAEAVSSDLENMNMAVVTGYVFYFIAGYYVSSIELSRKQRIVIYCAGLAGFALTIVLDLLAALKTQTPCSTYYDNFTVNVFLEALAVFVFFKYHRFGRQKLNRFMIKLSKYSFGVYLMHVFLIERLAEAGIDPLMCSPVMAVPAVSIAVFALSMLLSFILNRIPGVRKYIV